MWQRKSCYVDMKAHVGVDMAAGLAPMKKRSNRSAFQTTCDTVAVIPARRSSFVPSPANADWKYAI